MVAQVALALCIVLARFCRLDAVRLHDTGARPSTEGDLARSLPPELVEHVLSLVPPTVAYAYGNGRVRLWPGPREIRAPSEEAVVFLPGEEQQLLTTGNINESKTVVWSIESLQPVTKLQLDFPFEMLWGSRPFPDGQRVVSLTPLCAVIWSATSGRLLQRIDVGRRLSEASEVHVLPPGDLVLIVSHPDVPGGPVEPGLGVSIIIFNTTSGRRLPSWTDELARHSAVAVSPCGRKVLVAEGLLSARGTSLMSLLLVFDSHTGALEVSLEVPSTPRPTRIHVSRGGARIFALVNGAILIWNGATAELFRSLSMVGGIIDYAIDSDGCRVFAFSGNDGIASDMVWDVDSGTALRSLDGRAAAQDLSALLVSPTGDVVATCVQFERAENIAHLEDRDEIVFDSYLVTQVLVWHGDSGIVLHTFEDERRYGWDDRQVRCNIALFSAAKSLMNDSPDVLGLGPQWSE